MIKVIGIDPDMRAPGVCFMNADGFHISKYTLAALVEDVKLLSKQGFIFAVEDVNKIKAMYPRIRKGGAAVHGRIAQNVGMVKASGTIIIDYIEHMGGTVVLVPVGVGKATKKDGKLFNKITGYTGRTNEDARDAYWIADYAYKKLKLEQ